MLHWSIVTHAQARQIADAKHLPHCAIRKIRLSQLPIKKRKAKAFLSHRGSRSRTRIDGFGDRFPTIRRFPFIRKKGSFASVLASDALRTLKTAYTSLTVPKNSRLRRSFSLVKPSSD